LTANCSPQTGLSACVIFLGCPKNQVDSEHVLGSLTGAGYQPTTDPRSADLVVITTCAFLQSAVRESEAAIEEALKLKQGSPTKEVIVAGCLVERYGRGLKRKFPGVDLWVRLADMPRLAQLLASSSSKSAISNLQSAVCNASSPALRPSPRVLSTPPHFAYLKIADGCDNRCSYCMIPVIRGPFRSRPMPDIIAEARALACTGVKELLLIAQDTTLYGSDIYSQPSLARLLEQLGKVGGIHWLRLMYTHPAHITEGVIDQFASNPKLCRYIDLPIQHMADHLLAKMNRRYTRKDVELLLDSLRAIPDMHIRTTIIAGLPGETARDFEELLAFVRAARFDRLSCYAYSPEPGTRAARFAGQVSPAVKKERVRRLMLAQAAISRANLRKLVGRKVTVLVDALTADTESHHKGTKAQRGHEKRTGLGTAIGRTEWDAPEIDGVVRLTGRRVHPGTFVRALVTASSTHDLLARAT
jgi:ribosomal protein S12 methylthiotransferase